MLKRLLPILILIFFCVLIFAQDTDLTYDRLVAHLTYLASEKLEGRGPGTAGIDSAASYIANVFENNGLLPGGDDNTFFQKMTINIGVQLGKENSLSINGNSIELKKSFIPLGFSAKGEYVGSLVFAGYGIIAREYNYNDYENIDVTGKLALVLLYEPGEDDSASVFNGTDSTVHSSLRTKAINAKSKGAAGVILVRGPRYHPDNNTLIELDDKSGYANVGIPVVQVSQRKLDQILGKGRLAELQNKIESSGKPNSLYLDDVDVKLATDLVVKQAEIRNVVGVLPGDVADLNNSPLVIGAHYDHLGYGGPASRAPGVTEIHNGADDNASGVAALLEISTLMANSDQSLKRPVVFIAFSGEEIGLIGSTYYADHPIFPNDKTIAMLNMDTIGRMENNQLIIFGGGTAVEWDRIVNGYNFKYKFKTVLQKDGYGPSDQASFYAKDIPVLHFFTGANIDYHKPSDDVDKINFTDLSRITLFVAEISEYMANREDGLTFSTAGAVKPATASDRPSGHGGKRPWLGTVPDFSYQAGDGLRLNGVSPGSPCEKAGLQAGDVIIQIDEVEIKSIYELTHILQSRAVGDVITVVFSRAGKKNSVPVTLVSR